MTKEPNTNSLPESDYDKKYDKPEIEERDYHYKFIVPGFERENVVVAGWARYGSQGIINSSVDEANYLGQNMQHRLLHCVDPQNREHELSNDFEEFLENDSVYKSSWADWVKIRQYEKDMAYEESRYWNKVLNAEDLIEKLEIIKNLPEKVPEELPEIWSSNHRF